MTAAISVIVFDVNETLSICRPWGNASARSGRR